jgi:hypothetical protein
MEWCLVKHRDKYTSIRSSSSLKNFGNVFILCAITWELHNYRYSNLTRLHYVGFCLFYLFPKYFERMKAKNHEHKIHPDGSNPLERCERCWTLQQRLTSHTHIHIHTGVGTVRQSINRPDDPIYHSFVMNPYAHTAESEVHLYTPVQSFSIFKHVKLHQE